MDSLRFAADLERAREAKAFAERWRGKLAASPAGPGRAQNSPRR